MKKAIKIGLAVIGTVYALNVGYHSITSFPDFDNYISVRNQWISLNNQALHLKKAIERHQGSGRNDDLTNRLTDVEAKSASLEMDKKVYWNQWWREFRKGILPRYIINHE